MTSNNEITQKNIDAKDVASYILLLGEQYGDLISPLKMQKLVYYTYVSYLVEKRGGEKLFEEQIEAWPMGPVVPSLYHELKQYGSSPIPVEFAGISEDQLEGFKNKFSEEVLEMIKKTYEEYGTLTAFELVMLTHQEKPWSVAREGLEPGDSGGLISDEEILAFYSN